MKKERAGGKREPEDYLYLCVDGLLTLLLFVVLSLAHYYFGHSVLGWVAVVAIGAGMAVFVGCVTGSAQRRLQCRKARRLARDGEHDAR